VTKACWSCTNSSSNDCTSLLGLVSDCRVEIVALTPGNVHESWTDQLRCTKHLLFRTHRSADIHHRILSYAIGIFCRKRQLAENAQKARIVCSSFWTSAACPILSTSASMRCTDGAPTTKDKARCETWEEESRFRIVVGRGPVQLLLYSQ
jgi:hypothetical protein